MSLSDQCHLESPGLLSLRVVLSNRHLSDQSYSVGKRASSTVSEP